jgi:isomerase DpgB
MGMNKQWDVVVGEFTINVDIDTTKPLAELTAAIAAVCDRIDDSQSPTVVVLRLGTSLPEYRQWPGVVDMREVSRWERAVRRLERSAGLNIAVAGGPCGGPALDLLLATDLRIAAPDLLVLPPVTDGRFWPGMLMYRLVQQLGIARARQIVLWGEDISAERAHELGLVDQVTQDITDALSKATSKAMTSTTPGKELAVRRQLLFDATSSSFEDALGLHLSACDRELRRQRTAPARLHQEEQLETGQSS